MIDQKRIKIFLNISALGFFLFILWIIYLADTAQSSIFFDFIKMIPYGDKLGHMVLYGILSFLVSLALNFKKLKIGKIYVYYGVLLVFIFAFIEELTQGFYPNRTLDFFDLLADLVGLTLFSLLLRKIENIKNS